MRRLLSLLLGVGCAALGGGARAQAVRVVTETTAYAYVKDGKVSGPATEIVEKTLQNAGLAYKINLYPWARAYDVAQTDPDVLIYMMVRTPERETRFHWVGEFMKTGFHFYKLRERADIQVPDLDAARPYAIGVQRDDVRHRYLVKKGFSRLVLSASAAEDFSKLLKRQVDLSVMNDGDTLALCEQAQFDCRQLERLMALDDLTLGVYMAYSLTTSQDVVDRTRAAFEALRAEGTVRRTMDTVKTAIEPQRGASPPSSTPPAPRKRP